MKNNKKKSVLLIAGLVVVIAALLCVYQFTKGGTSKGEKEITIEVVHGDETTKSFEVITDREFLGEVLRDEKLVEGEDGPYGMYITTADGETADNSKQQWWCITKGGGQVNTSADQTPIRDKEKYELTLTTGY